MLHNHSTLYSKPKPGAIVRVNLPESMITYQTSLKTIQAKRAIVVSYPLEDCDDNGQYASLVTIRILATGQYTDINTAWLSPDEPITAAIGDYRKVEDFSPDYTLIQVDYDIAAIRAHYTGLAEDDYTDLPGFLMVRLDPSGTDYAEVWESVSYSVAWVWAECELAYSA